MPEAINLSNTPRIRNNWGDDGPGMKGRVWRPVSRVDFNVFTALLGLDHNYCGRKAKFNDAIRGALALARVAGR